MANRMMRPVQLGFMSPARANQLLLEGFPQPAATASRIPQYTTPAGVVPPMALTPSQLSAARAQQRSATRPIMPLEAAAMRGSVIPPGQRRTPPAPSPMQTIGSAFRQPLTSPTGQGLAAAALTGLEYGGPQLQPTSLGQGLARMGAAGLKAYTDAAAAEQAREDKRAEREALAAYREAQLEIQRQTLDVKRAAAEAQAAAAAPGFEDETKLRKEYDKASEDFKEANVGFQKVQNAAAATPSGANDLALIFGYMKVLDPGSVVREGEFANAENSGGVAERIRNSYNRILRGERLSDVQREAFIQSARTQFAPYIDAQSALEARYRGLAEVYDFNVDNVVTSYLPKKGSRTNPYEFNTEAEAEASGLKGFAYIGGRLARID